MTTSKTEPKAGIQTSEFLVTAVFVVLALLCATALVALDKVTAEQWVDVVKWGGGLPVAGYAVSRGLAKR